MMMAQRLGAAFLIRATVLGALAGLAACETGSSSRPDAATAFAPPAQSDPGLRLVEALPPPGGAGPSEQSITAGDRLRVEIFEVDELGRTVQVDARGMISLPLIGEVPAAGKNVRELEAEIETRYGARYLQSPDVAVFVEESVGARVAVDGEVTRAGLYPTTAGSTLMQVLAQAGGFRPIADPRKVYVFRQAGGQRLVANYDVAAIRAGRLADPPIRGGDVVVVFGSSSRIAFQTLKEALGVASDAARMTVLP